MNEIKDLHTYLSRMDKALLDKCWWIDKIAPEVDTVIDFGCAAGNLKSMIDYLAPKKYKYIGIDTAPEMVNECIHKGIRVYTSLSVALKHCKPENTIIVLNSVIHELLSYEAEPYKILRQIGNSKCRYIAIRDMCLTDIQLDNVDAIRNQIEHSKYANQWYEFRTICECTRQAPYNYLSVIEKEFLLKYWYTENWDREKYEQYLWTWAHDLWREEHVFMDYKIEDVEDFYIPFVRNKVQEDFGIKYTELTHKKVLLQLRKD